MDSLIANGENRPSPNDFINFLPWACNQFQMDSTIVIAKVLQNEYFGLALGHKDKKNRTTKQNVSRNELGSTDGKESSPNGLPENKNGHNKIYISAYCDPFGNLVEIKFDKNRQIPCLLLKIIALCIKYQNNLTRLTINSGMDKHTIYEMDKFLNITNITEICLDNSFFPEANYDLLLEGGNKIRYLSLARCKINDTVMENISKKLIFPSPASELLTVLILASNRITDKGIVFLADALRSNRKLSYISLADNNLTDDGVSLILNSLMEFSLTEDEIIRENRRHMHYLKEKRIMINYMIKELRSGEYDKRDGKSKRKVFRPISAVPSVKKGNLGKESSLKSLGDSKSNPNLDYLLYDKALNMVEEKLGEFNDPFGVANTTVKYGIKYCHGNNTVAFLNLAYNNLSYISLKKLLSVLLYQKLFDRRPKGLVNLCVEGNNVPNSCKELSQIADLLEEGITSSVLRNAMHKKRATSKMHSLK
ncbi:uncharacterized protein LOC120634634 [Pararge aegeria]|uniref:Jg12068 protein n=1 Tax=Pararge aegeria aegeria TaxID=348720 RepID=A0A8S4RKI8_9NEOP|nr:uncharacterized protein LOC120634634 [Pararge aegeria]CAH2237354.1 jg12068 [Pararge aegeria aegeria]